ncbi:MAG: FtsQ-type POTRA domain-containing protein [Acidimicrobiia bacterium]|nr:FtsQ-type POTRA domain-containing protein [Acidimicrobiia bacterium]
MSGTDRTAHGVRAWPWLALATLAAAAAFALHSPWLSVGEIEIVGAVHSDPEPLIAATGVGEGAILIWVDTGRLERAVAADPWVADVRVERVWPDRLVVEVLEREPVAWFEGTTSWMLVASDGTVLEVVAEPGGGHLRAVLAFPDLVPGDRPADPTWNEIVAMAVTLRDDFGGAMTVELRGTELWSEALGHPVRLGYPIDLADKARTLRALLVEDLPRGATIDVSSPLRPAVEGGESPQGAVEATEEQV